MHLFAILYNFKKSERLLFFKYASLNMHGMFTWENSFNDVRFLFLLNLSFTALFQTSEFILLNVNSLQNITEVMY